MSNEDSERWVPAVSTYEELRRLADKWNKEEASTKGKKRKVWDPEKMFFEGKSPSELITRHVFVKSKNTLIKTNDNKPDITYKLRFEQLDKETGEPYGKLKANSSLFDPDVIDLVLPDGKEEEATKRKEDYSTVEEESYEVERILHTRKDKLSTWYLVKWLNYPMRVCTWQVASDFQEDSILKIAKTRENALAALAERYRLKQPSRANGFHLKDAYITHNLFERKVNFVCHKFNQAALFVENWVDNKLEINDFEFSLESTYSKAVKKFLEVCEPRETCHCRDPECLVDDNCCRHNNAFSSHSLLYRANGLRLDRIADYKNVTIWECFCGCSCKLGKCANKVVQRGRQIPLVLFKTKEKKWGIYAAEKIKRGTFICEYIGHLFTRKEAEERNRPKYAFDMVQCPDQKMGLTLDAEQIGNEARFVNHSCNPNAAALRVFVDFNCSDFHRIAYFAIKNISIGEEITIDYSGGGSRKSRGSVRTSGIRCLCGAPKCRGTIG